MVKFHKFTIKLHHPVYFDTTEPIIHQDDQKQPIAKLYNSMQ